MRLVSGNVDDASESSSSSSPVDANIDKIPLDHGKNEEVKEGDDYYQTFGKP